MKKTNFIVVFWLLLALISFVVFIINFSSLGNNLAYYIFPGKDIWDKSRDEIIREFIKIIPMIIFTAVTFIIGIKQGLKKYNSV